MTNRDLWTTTRRATNPSYLFLISWLRESQDLSAQTEKSSNFTKLDSDKSRRSPSRSELVVLLPAIRNRCGTLIVTVAYPTT